MKADSKTPYRLIYAFCTEHGICTSCKVRWKWHTQTLCAKCIARNKAAADRRRAAALKAKLIKKGGGSK